MSDLISKSELLKAMETWDKFGYDEHNRLIRIDSTNEEYVPYVRYEDMVNCVMNMPTAYDVDKVVEELEEAKDNVPVNRLLDDIIKEKPKELGQLIAYDKAIEIVKREAEKRNGGWIPCSVSMPEEAFGCLVTVMDSEPSTQTDFENILPYFVGYDGETWNDADGEEIPFEVIAWQKLPQPYQPKGE